MNRSLLVTTSLCLLLYSLRALAQSRKFAHDSFELLLIGKDGGVKANSHRIKDLDEFITLIDGMPMRKQEADEKQSTLEC